MGEERGISMHVIIARRYRYYAALQEFRVSIVLSALLFLASLGTSFFAIAYATERASNPVTDIILSNTPVFHVDGLFVYGTVLIVAFGTLLLILHPKRIPFTLYSLAMFYFIRSGFISLTHLGPFPVQTENNFDLGVVTSKFFFGGDLFFSGHVGFTFLLALIFWRERALRYIFLGSSIYFAGVVLLGHLHYTIDVVSAFFITYGILHLAEWLFPKERALFYAEEEPEL